jgi:SAM-dependent methyltransferase
MCRVDAAAQQEKVGAYWDQRAREAQAGITRWWQSAPVVSHINRVVCGRRIPGAHAGFHELIKAERPGGRFKRAVSVGCGQGSKELSLVRAGIVESFDLFELSQERIDLGRAAAQRAGMAHCMRFHRTDAFASPPAAPYDLVYWNNSLHHMMDVEDALFWSRGVLQKGGLFAMDDFTGPTRFQWSDAALDAASRARALMPARLLANPRAPNKSLPTTIPRPDPKRLAEIDPSEAADSGRTLECLSRVFPKARVLPTGGAIYGLTLNDLIGNFRDEDAPLLESLLLLDGALAVAGCNHYAVALAVR